ncbi:uncharacterized protein LOC133205967 [Saccostrea echinata]|uniref:uncharacterized protein LOC133205967 n=1 Tax=Saccostrea echinata TaxID=191078 RepID=UPI002A83A0B5|nr:uncharacterized protein LOC133205967 [Saccostrea echinata]
MMLLVWGIVWMTFKSVVVAGTCFFPDHLKNSDWHYQISSGNGEKQTLQFSGEVLSVKDVLVPSDSYQLYCVERRGEHAFLFESPSAQSKKYKCIEFLERGRSILQMRTSSFSESPNVCNDGNLVLDEWLLVSNEEMAKETGRCPFSGGFNLKVRDSNGNAHGCNHMELPMRLESECIAGEGMTFDFRRSECTYFVPMNIYQKTYCVTNWNTRNFIFVILKAVNGDGIWVMRVPKRDLGYYNSRIVVELFTDLIASESNTNSVIEKSYSLTLEKEVQRSFCADEYESCSKRLCSPVDIRQCPKSCGTCDPNTVLPICSFPRRFLGEWYSQDIVGTRRINISDSTLSIGNVGQFSCVQFDDSPSRSTRMFTTESVYYNGCRPRYTCVAFKRLGKSVLGYSISQSFVWPITLDSPGRTICDESRFRPDEEPVSDLYHSYDNSYKPILPISRTFIPTSCDLPSLFSFTAHFDRNRSCVGEFYEDCANPRVFRLDYHNCRYTSVTSYTYYCAATFRENYWEKLVILQSATVAKESKCLSFSTVYPDRAFLLPTSHCDVYAWQYVDANIRQSLVEFTIRSTGEKCKFIPTTTTVTVPTTTSTSQGLSTSRLPDSPRTGKRKLDVAVNSAIQSDSYEAKDKYQEMIKTTLSAIQTEKSQDNNHRLKTVDERMRETSHSEICRSSFMNIIFIGVVFFKGVLELL